MAEENNLSHNLASNDVIENSLSVGHITENHLAEKNTQLKLDGEGSEDIIISKNFGDDNSIEIEEVFLLKEQGSNEINQTKIKSAWDFSLAILQQEIKPQIFLAYFKPLNFGFLDEKTSTFIVFSPSRLVSTHIIDNFLPRIKDCFLNCLKEVFNSNLTDYFNKCSISFVVENNITSANLKTSSKDLNDGSDKNASFFKDITYVDKSNLEHDVSCDLQSDENIYKNVNPQKYIIVKKFKDNSQAVNSQTNNVLNKNPDENRQDESSNETNDFGTLNTKYTFENYVVGANNQFCHAAALRVAEQPGKSYNPLFIYGGVGLGKTHLLHAIGNSVIEKDPTAKVLYMSSEAFTNELILALRFAKMDEFKKKLRSINVLLIDDIQFISGKERTQEEFFHTFNSLYAAKNQIIITSDRLPSDIPGIEERLQTRFSWGLTADLQAPDFETRVAILNRKAAIENFALPEDVSHFIAENISSNVRELEGALTRLNALVNLQNIPLNRDTAHTALKAIIQPRKVQISVGDIKKAVATKFNIKVTDIISKRRTKNLSFPRHIAMYLCRKHTTASYPDIGEEFGGRDHSSVIHAANVVSSKIKTDSEVKELILDIEEILGIKK